MVDATCPPLGPGGRWAAFCHLLFYGTLVTASVLALGGAAMAPGRRALAAGLAVLLGVWYAWWVVHRGDALARSTASRATYFIGAALAWTALLLLDPAYEILEVTAVLQVLGYLRWRAGIVAATLAVLLGHIPYGLDGDMDPVHVLWIVVALAMLALIVMSIRAMADQSGRRQRLIDELKSTRQELAVAERLAGVLEERQRLAGELHDTLAQAFTSIVMLLEAAEASMRAQPAAAADHVAQARQAARDGLREARRVVWALRPESLERGTLPDALARVTAELARQTGIAARTVVTGEPQRLPAEVEVTLIRATQEALANVRRHARARHVTVTLSYMDDVVTLDVRDDGAGFDASALPAGPDRHGGLGLVAMRERAEALGGSLTIESAPGEGTSLMVELPLGPRADDAAKPREALES